MHYSRGEIRGFQEIYFTCIHEIHLPALGNTCSLNMWWKEANILLNIYTTHYMNHHWCMFSSIVYLPYVSPARFIINCITINEIHTQYTNVDLKRWKSYIFVHILRIFIYSYTFYEFWKHVPIYWFDTNYTSISDDDTGRYKYLVRVPRRLLISRLWRNIDPKQVCQSNFFLKWIFFRLVRILYSCINLHINVSKPPSCIAHFFFFFGR